jgi:hypothetical protein
MFKAERAIIEQKKLKSHWSEESQLTQKVTISILENLEQLNGLIYQMASDIKYLRTHLKTKKREPSEYNLHVAKEIASGKTLGEAIESWKK